MPIAAKPVTVFGIEFPSVRSFYQALGYHRSARPTTVLTHGSYENVVRASPGYIDDEHAIEELKLGLETRMSPEQRQLNMFLYEAAADYLSRMGYDPSNKAMQIIAVELSKDPAGFIPRISKIINSKAP